jgi:hypothetical protein
MTGLLLMWMETRVPRVVFGHACPMDIALADITVMAVHAKTVHKKMINFFMVVVVSLHSNNLFK